MRAMRAKAILLSAIAVFAALPAAAAARPLRFQPDWIMPVQDDRGERQRLISSREVVSMLRSRYGGELVHLELVRGERPFYEVRWRMPNSELRDFTVDAVTGQIR